MINEPQLNKAMVAFQKECPTIEKDAKVEITKKTGGKFTFKYASYGNIIETVKPLLNKNGIWFYHQTDQEKGVRCVIEHESGEKRKSKWIKISASTDPKDQGGAITYAKRYTITALLGIATEDDVDTDLNKTVENKKPKIGQKAYEQLLERITEGNQAVVGQAFQYFSLTPEQEAEIKEYEMLHIKP